MLGFPPLNRGLYNTQSNDSFQFIRSCIDACSSSHDCVLRQSPAQRAWPSRLIEITKGHDGDNLSIRLVNGQETCPQYITLSHCWGQLDKTPARTLVDNLARRQSNISFSDLTPTFRDAVKISYQLDIHHLWIDAICIIQDSEADWSAESVKMADIYRNSFLTIAASKGEDSFSGCFNQNSISSDRSPYSKSDPDIPQPTAFHTITATGTREASRRDRFVVDITTTTSTSEKSTVIFWDESRGDEPSPLESSPLNERGWILQERILSPRTIHFTATQLVWECQQHYRQEDNFQHQHYKRKTKCGIIRKFGDAGFTRETLDYWYDDVISKDYARRRFTKFSDRLIALAGLATAYQSPHTGAYIAGSWESSIAVGLAWGHDRLATASSVSLCPSPRRSPTWSWSSHDCVIKWPSFCSDFVTNEHFCLVGTNMEFWGENPTEFHRVTGGFITVAGKVVEIPYETEPGSTSIQTLLSGCKLKLLFDHTPPPAAPPSTRSGFWGNIIKAPRIKKSVSALVLGYFPISIGQSVTFLLLAPCPGTSSSYYRAGTGHMSCPTKENGKLKTLFTGPKFPMETIQLY